MDNNDDGYSFDVIIIGAGVIGCSIARELSKYKGLKVCVLEKESDICQGASKANSGIIHGGYDAKHGTLKGKFSRKGNLMFDKLNEELDFGFKRVGSFVLAFHDSEIPKLHELKENGELNGVDDLVIMSGDEIRAKYEPNVSLEVVAGLFCPSAGIVNPFEFVIALMENAIVNGAKLFLERKVVGVKNEKGTYFVETERTFIYGSMKNRKEVFKAKRVINCAGLYSDDVSAMIRKERLFEITPRKGEYLLFDGHEVVEKQIKHVLFQVPTEKWGKGILVAPTSRNNLIVGPSAIIEKSKLNVDTNFQELAYVIWAARRTVPHINTNYAITSFSGIRARPEMLLKSDAERDFIIEESQTCSGWIDVAGIESPGLTSAPAIACEIAGNIANKLQLALKNKDDFFPKRTNPVRFFHHDGDKLKFLNMVYDEFEKVKSVLEYDDDEKKSEALLLQYSIVKDIDFKTEEIRRKLKLLETDPLFDEESEKTIICKCEKITKGEILRALKGPITVTSTDGVKLRTRCGMGWCQGGRCQKKVESLIKQEMLLRKKAEAIPQTPIQIEYEEDFEVTKCVRSGKNPQRGDRHVFSKL